MHRIYKITVAIATNSLLILFVVFLHLLATCDSVLFIRYTNDGIPGYIQLSFVLAQRHH